MGHRSRCGPSVEDLLALALLERLGVEVLGWLLRDLVADARHVLGEDRSAAGVRDDDERRGADGPLREDLLVVGDPTLDDAHVDLQAVVGLRELEDRLDHVGAHRAHLPAEQVAELDEGRLELVEHLDGLLAFLGLEVVLGLADLERDARADLFDLVDLGLDGLGLLDRGVLAAVEVARLVGHPAETGTHEDADQAREDRQADPALALDIADVVVDEAHVRVEGRAAGHRIAAEVLGLGRGRDRGRCRCRWHVHLARSGDVDGLADLTRGRNVGRRPGNLTR
jgi:hypothetical protein